MSTPHSSVSMKGVWSSHRTTIIVLLLLGIVAGSSRYFLSADLLQNPSAGGNESSATPELNMLRTCSSVGTVFEHLNSLQEVMVTFRSRVSEVVAEREQFLSTPSKWQCLAGDDSESEPPMDKLTALADGLPGWHFQSPLPFVIGNQTAPAMKPVTFSSFASILGEFERAYECKLTEFQDSAFLSVATNNDQPPGLRQFCCDAQSACVQATSDAVCAGPVVSDPGCGGVCPLRISQQQFVGRLGEYWPLQLVERQRARTALQRTISALRSFEMNYAYAKQLTCFQRASLDLKNELSLLADTTSCLPRIWDAVTSLHDRKQ